MMTKFRGCLTIVLLAGSVQAASKAGPEAHQLGPIGLKGTTAKTEIRVTEVAKGSPADGKINVGDVIVGAGSAKFKKDVRQELADAIDQAETEAAKGILSLSLKGGKTVEVRLKVLGSYSDTAPYKCPKTDAIITQTADYLVRSTQAKGKTKQFNAGKGELENGWLGLLATGEQKYIDVVKENLPKQEWVHPDKEAIAATLRGDKDMGYVGWYWGYRCITLGEYFLLTGDKSVLPALETYAVALAKGQDAGGLWGHRMATPARNGRLAGYAQMNQNSLTCFMGMLMAQKCGIKDPDLERGIEKTYAYYSTFIGKGTFNYGVHGPNTKSFNNNGMSATAALNMALAGNREGVDFFSRLAATAYDGLESGHATFYFNVMWTPLGANLAGPEVTQQFFKKSRWLHTLYRAWDGSFTFDGGESKAGNSSGAHLLAYCLGRRALFITGRNADESLWLKGAAATQAIEVSQIDYKNKSADELIALFDHSIPQVRIRAVAALREKQGGIIPDLAKFTLRGTKRQKLSAISFFGYGCTNTVALPQLMTLGAILRDKSQYPEVRAAAASALAQLGEPAYPYYGDMLKFVVDEEPGDRFGDVDQAVGGCLNTLCADPFKAGLVKDKDLFYKAAVKLAEHKRQHVRADGLRMLAGMPLEDFHRVGDTVMHVIRDRDPTYQSYHSPGGPVGAGVTVLANLGIEEGIQGTLDVLEIESGKGSFKIRMVADGLGKYGANAKPALEKLRAHPGFKDIENNPKLNRQWRAMVEAIANDKNPRKLITFEEAKRVKAGGP